MTPPQKTPDTLLEIDGWGQWWRGQVARDLDRLDSNIVVLRSDFEKACRELRKEIGAVDKTASVDIRALQVQAAIWGLLGGSIISAIIGIIVYFVTRG